MECVCIFYLSHVCYYRLSSGHGYEDITIEVDIMNPDEPILATIGWEAQVRDSYVGEQDVFQTQFYTVVTQAIQDLDTKITNVYRNSQNAHTTEKHEREAQVGREARQCEADTSAALKDEFNSAIKVCFLCWAPVTVDMCCLPAQRAVVTQSKARWALKHTVYTLTLFVRPRVVQVVKESLAEEVRARREAVTKERQEREDNMAVEKQERKNAVAAALRQCVADPSAAFRVDFSAVLQVCILGRRQTHPRVLSPRTAWCCTTVQCPVVLTHIARPCVALCPGCTG